MNTTVIGIPLGPAMANAPLLTLLEPVTDRMNVTLNGNLNPGSPGVTIESVSADWNDGTITKIFRSPGNPPVLRFRDLYNQYYRKPVR